MSFNYARASTPNALPSNTLKPGAVPAGTMAMSFKHVGASTPCTRTPSTTTPATPSAMTPANMALSATGEPLIYPTPLLIRNTFIEVAGERPFALDDFYEERRVRSCPTSGVDNGDASDDIANTNAQVRRVATTPAARSTTAPTFGFVQKCSASRDPEISSESSTADTVGSSVHGTALWRRRAQACAAASSNGANLAGGITQTSALYPNARLESMLPLPACAADNHGSGVGEGEGFPSRGSLGHHAGTCRPCAFFHTKGCENGLNCEFCHLCQQGEKKQRRKERNIERKASDRGRNSKQWAQRLTGGVFSSGLW